MIQVLVVEDDQAILNAHSQYVSRLPDFCLAGTATTAAEAIRCLLDQRIDLVLLDVNLPDATGLALVQRMRSIGIMADVIAVTGVRELNAIRAALSLGVIHYVLKPFTFATLAQRLQAYAQFRAASGSLDAAVSQNQIDAVIGQLRQTGSVALPKGLSEDLLAQSAEVLHSSSGWVSAQQVAESMAVSRVTARRYLEYLCTIGAAVRHSRTSTGGRPTIEYSWRPGGAN